MIIFPNAKINLGLNIVAKRADGYHDLETVFYPIPIHDRLEVTLSDKSFPSGKPYLLTTSGVQVDGDDEYNLVVRAYMRLRSEYTLPNVIIDLTKNIPTGAGMGGGSSDCAYMIRLLNTMCHIQMTPQQMEQTAAQLGADCAFFVQATPAYATGIGNVLSPVNLSLKGYKIVVVKPDIHVSTAEAFAHITPHYPVKHVFDIVKQPIETWKTELVNDFEDSIFANHPEIKEIKEKLYGQGAIYAVMSGSGSSVIGLFRDVNPKMEESFRGMFFRILEIDK